MHRVVSSTTHHRVTSVDNPRKSNRGTGTHPMFPAAARSRRSAVHWDHSFVLVSLERERLVAFIKASTCLK